MYLLVCPKNVILNKKYKIVEVEEEEEHTFIDKFTKIVRIHSDLYLMIHGDKIYTSLNCRFYDFVSDNPKEKRERRTVNLILRRILMDDNFEW